jgi:hypothetical protein
MLAIKVVCALSRCQTASIHLYISGSGVCIDVDFSIPRKRLRSTLVFIMNTTQRKSARILEQEQRKKSTSSTVGQGSQRRLQTHFDFFGLPLEIRNMVYDTLWKSKNRVAAYHEPSHTGILAYYNGMVLDQTDLRTGEAICAEEDRVWRPSRAAGLPKWLLINKQTVKEGMAQFHLKANWNIWSLVPRYGNPLDEPPRTPEAPLMNPRHARSISLPRMLIQNEERVFSIWFRYDNIVEILLRQDDRVWLHSVIKNLGDAPHIRKLQISIGCPYLDFNRNIGREYNGKPFRVEMPLQGSFRELIKGCKALEQLEVDIFHYDYSQYAEEVLDTEYLNNIRPEIMAAMGGDVSETMTTKSPVSGGYLNNGRVSMPLLDWKLIFTKETEKQ